MRPELIILRNIAVEEHLEVKIVTGDGKYEPVLASAFANTLVHQFYRYSRMIQYACCS
jgi:hypothetical protein